MRWELKTVNSTKWREGEKMHVLFSKAKCDYIQLSLFFHSGYGEKPMFWLCFYWHIPAEQQAPWTICAKLHLELKAEAWRNWSLETSNDLPPNHSFIHSFISQILVSIPLGWVHTIPARPHDRGRFQSRIYKYLDQRFFLAPRSALIVLFVGIEGKGEFDSKRPGLSGLWGRNKQ